MVVARTAVVEEVIITAAATTIGIIRGIGTAVVGAEGTAVRTTTIALRGTTTTGTRGRTRAPEAEGAADTTSETIRTRIIGIVARRTGSALARTIRREAAGEITVPEVTAAIIIVAATEAPPVGTMTARRPTTNATAVAGPAPVMITTRRRAAEEAQANGLITAAAAGAAEEAELAAAVTSRAIRWDRRARWVRRGFHAAAEAPARCAVPAGGHGRRCRRI